jgi:hypothetical protein
MKLIVFILFFYSSASFALEISEKLNLKIIKILPKNIVQINLGTKDQIEINEQVKFYQDDEFLARGLCLKASLDHSFWKLYRVVSPKEFNVNNEKINLKAIPMRDVPWEYIEQPLEQYQNIISEYAPDKKEDKTRAETLNAETIVRARIFASPFRIESINNFNDFHAGVDIETIGIKKFDVHFELEGYRFSADDVTNDQSVAQTQVFTSLMASHATIITPARLFLGIDYFTQTQKEVSPYEAQFRIYPIGIERRLEISSKAPLLSFFYAPVLENFEMQKRISASEIEIKNDFALRHLFGFRFITKPTENLEILGSFKIHPLQDTDKGLKFDFNDLDFQSEVSVRYLAGKKFFIDYTNSYSIDKRRGLYTNLKEQNIIHSLNFNYQFFQ